MKKLLTLLLICLTLLLNAQSGWNMNLLGTYDYTTTQGNDIWGWADASGNEYALVGLRSGLSVVNVTNPSFPSEEFFISDVNSTWRDIKTWGNHAYVTTEGGGGLLIVDLSDLSGQTYTHYIGSFNSAHNIYIDENGIAYIFGSNIGNGGAIFLDVATDPMNPSYLGTWNGQYIHDGMVRGDTMWAGCIYAGKVFAVDVSNKSNPSTIGSHSTPNNFTHNAWVSDNGDYVFTTDETSGAYITAYDVSDLNNIQEVDRIQSNPGSGTIPHNTHVDGNFLITSYYRDGTTVHDITYPDNMIQVAYYDSYSGSGNGFDGCWGTYPFLPSGNIISSDINSGSGGNGRLLIYGRNFQQASFLSGTVTNANTGFPISNASIQIVSTSYTATTNLLGEYSLGSVNSGVFQVLFSASGYIPITLNVTLSSGNMIILDADLSPGSGLPGCTDPTAVNYDPNATIDDGSCIYCSGTWVSLNMYDTYGDGWNGNTWTATSTTGGASYGPYTISNGSSGIESFCLPDDCYDIVCDYGTWQTEVSWTLTDVTGTILLSGGAPYSSQYASGSASCITSVVGCMNPNATNYDPLATSSIAFGGIPSNAVGTGSYYSGNRHLIFDAYVESNIVSAVVYAQSSNTITFELRDNSSIVIDDTTITVASGQQRLYFDFDVPVGNNYELGIAGTNSGLYRNNGGVSYPYDIGGLVSFTGSSANALYYYFYYDIEVEAVCTGITSTVYGCTNPTACNYDPLANTDDGSCLTDYGCTDPLATNYDASATCDDGSCFYGMPGCTDPTAINYNPAATIDDGSCIYCVYGCMDATMFNYNPSATCDSTGGSGCIAFVYGCTDATALNYYAGVNSDDGSCVYVAGCTDATACNYDPLADFDDGSCEWTSCIGCGAITGVNLTDVIHDRARLNWDDMNDSSCVVDQIRFQLSTDGGSTWSIEKTMGAPVGNNAPCLNTSKLVLNLIASTVYDYRFKIWYQDGTIVTWHAQGTFTTADPCLNATNITVTPLNNVTKADFCWDAPAAPWTFIRLKYRENVPGSSFSNIGGMGVMSPTLCKEKGGLTPGLQYRVMWRTWCANGGPYRSPVWDGPVIWDQPLVRLEGGTTINNLDIYPNPSRDIFNVSFTSEDVQDLDVRVLNIVGEVVYTENLQQFVGEYTKVIDLATYTKGIYFLEIETNDGMINKKLILQ